MTPDAPQRSLGSLRQHLVMLEDASSSCSVKEYRESSQEQRMCRLQGNVMQVSLLMLMVLSILTLKSSALVSQYQATTFYFILGSHGKRGFKNTVPVLWCSAMHLPRYRGCAMALIPGQVLEWSLWQSKGRAAVGKKKKNKNHPGIAQIKEKIVWKSLQISLIQSKEKTIGLVFWRCGHKGFFSHSL